jgi:hypothetical protein
MMITLQGTSHKEGVILVIANPHRIFE